MRETKVGSWLDAVHSARPSSAAILSRIISRQWDDRICGVRLRQD